MMQHRRPKNWDLLKALHSHGLSECPKQDGADYKEFANTSEL